MALNDTLNADYDKKMIFYDKVDAVNDKILIVYDKIVQRFYKV